MLYKYFGPNRTRVLFDNLVRFSQASALNDPFESALLLRLKEERSLIEGLEEKIQVHLASIGIDVNDPIFSEAMAKAAQEMAQFTKTALVPSVVGKRVSEKMNSLFGVFSLSRVNDNLLMWAHYADSHRGFVLGLDEDHLFFNGTERLSKPINVVYSSIRSSNKPGDDSSTLDLLSRKSIDWAYEEEVRIFKAFPEVNEGSPPHPRDKVHLFRMPADVIKEVYIGANATLSDRNKILEFIQQARLRVEVFDAELSETRFELNFTPHPPRALCFRANEAYINNPKALSEWLFTHRRYRHVLAPSNSSRWQINAFPGDYSLKQ